GTFPVATAAWASVWVAKPGGAAGAPVNRSGAAWTCTAIAADSRKMGSLDMGRIPQRDRVCGLRARGCGAPQVSVGEWGSVKSGAAAASALGHFLEGIPDPVVQ